MYFASKNKVDRTDNVLSFFLYLRRGAPKNSLACFWSLRNGSIWGENNVAKSAKNEKKLAFFNNYTIILTKSQEK